MLDPEGLILYVFCPAAESAWPAGPRRVAFDPRCSGSSSLGAFSAREPINTCGAKTGRKRDTPDTSALSDVARHRRRNETEYRGLAQIGVCYGHWREDGDDVSCRRSAVPSEARSE
ncbi:hypothetical protein EVAR_45835_1 [Eumeta japonica]|uniref:Uncharacterized protein n=1 Tax=Eumeta variegata TaxID=151549 RepID=A0A4C1WKK8_EUMVA|nr:hypothetical protein EVAR_45835_1 [Eumeta japonica]